MPYEVVKRFEREVAEYSGATFGVAVESASAGLFLSCSYLKVKDVFIPRYTYPSVPCSIIHAGGKVHFHMDLWEGIYQLKPYPIWDGALRFKRKMYKGGLHVLSFHAKKLLPIGRGGMILTNDWNAVEWLRRARFDGRRECDLDKDSIDMLGWNMYMTPEQASRGLQLFNFIKHKDLEDLDNTKQNYPDLSKCSVYVN